MVEFTKQMFGQEYMKSYLKQTNLLFVSHKIHFLITFGTELKTVVYNVLLQVKVDRKIVMIL